VLAISVFLLIATFLLYWPVRHHPFVLYDVPEYVTQNPVVSAGLTLSGVKWAFSSFCESNWHPLTWISHMVDVSLFGLNPKGHHLVNVALHAANALLMFLVVRRMTGAVVSSAFVAAFFALHPMHVESVAWVAERKDLLSMFLFLSALGAYARFARTRRRRDYVALSFLFALGLLAKPMVVTFPFVLLLFDFWPLARTSFLGSPQGETLTRLIGEKFPLFLMSFASSWITYLAQQQGGSVASIQALPLSDRLANAGVGYIRYIIKMVWPDDLAVFYPYVDFGLADVLGAFLVLVVVTGLGFLVRREAPYLLVGWLFFLGTLLPVIGVVQVGWQSMADRYSYIPFTGLFLAIVFFLRDKADRKPLIQRLLVGGGCLILIAYAILSREQLQHWRTSENLFRHAIAVTEGNVFAYHKLGEALSAQGRVSEAIEAYQEAKALAPGIADIYLHLGLLLEEKGDANGALRHYQEAVAIAPQFGEAFFAQGSVYYDKHQFTDAVTAYERALDLLHDPARKRDTYVNLGNAYARLERFGRAIDCYERALGIDPSDQRAANNLRLVRRRVGK
jgi:Tfp pilus assembly protein PilF